MTATATLKRTTFRTSREMDFFSEKELTTQTGHPIEEWPYVFLKEAVDNALDACEEADIPPVVNITADPCGITVTDNGPGIPDETLQGALDFTIRASNREMYVAPDRGAQGNALMTLLSMPYVLDPEHGRLLVTTNGVRHDIVCRADPISQQAIVQDHPIDVAETQGTEIRIEWGEHHDQDDEAMWPFGDDFYPLWQKPVRRQFFFLIHGYSFLNPHLSITVDWFGETTSIEATDCNWSKWKPNKPTSPHWYEPRHLERLIAAYISHDRNQSTDRTVAEFVKEFDGLSGTKKRKLVLEESGLSRTKLSELATEEGLKTEAITVLLESMKTHTRIVKAPRLGVIGREHLAVRLEGLGCDPEQIEYSKIDRVDDGIPFVLESAFGWMGDNAPDQRHIFAGANWSPGINNPFRSFGQNGEGLEATLSQQRAGAYEPIVFMLHLAHPRVEYADRGKSAIVIGSDDESAC